MRGTDKVQGMKDVWVCGTAMRMLVTDVLSTQSTSDPDVVNGINESIACLSYYGVYFRQNMRFAAKETARRRR